MIKKLLPHIQKLLPKIQKSDVLNNSIFLFGLVLFSNVTVWGQLHIGTDVYVAEGGELHIAVEETVFEEGIVSTSRGTNYGLISFAPQSNWERADNNAHVDGFVRMHSNNTFSFPTGNDRIFQPAQIQRVNESIPVDISFSHQPHTNLQAETGIDQVSDEFYWELIGSQPATIALSWSAFSNLDQLTENDINRLGIVGYDGTQWRTIESELDNANFNDTSPSSLLSGSIRSKNPINLEGYTALTLARMGSTDMTIDVSQGFTPNGDGINDTWHIDRIDQFPNAHIIVYSRWERIVFEVENGYKNDWNGVYSNNNEPLPDGSYAYVIDLDNDGKMDLAGWIYITR